MNLEPGSRYEAVIYAFNVKGRSKDAFVLRASTLKTKDIVNTLESSGKQGKPCTISILFEGLLQISTHVQIKRESGWIFCAPLNLLRFGALKIEIQITEVTSSWATKAIRKGIHIFLVCN